MNAITYTEHMAAWHATEPVADAPWCVKCKEDCIGSEAEIQVDDDGGMGLVILSYCCDADVMLEGKVVEVPGHAWEAPDEVEHIDCLYDASDCGW